MSATTSLPLAEIFNWQGIGLVAIFALVAGVVIVGAFSLALVGLDRWSASRHPESARQATAPAPATPTGDITHAAMPVGASRERAAYGSLVMAIAGFAVCVLAVLIGLVSIVVKAK